tara:strand:+ start:1301 stop:2350 length:1050 start_codon:yes stop_codon:yes gene_type:complete
MTGIITKNTGRASGVVGTSAAGVPAVTSDPPTSDLSAGDMWLRTDLTSNNLKSYLDYGIQWSAGGNYPASLYSITSAGTGSDITSIGGIRQSPNTSVNTASEYNGTSWSGIPAYPVSMYGGHSSCASPGSDVTFAGGRTYPGSGFTTCNEWDGSSFSSGGSLSSARYIGLGAGTASAMSVIGGDPGTMSTREDYNGTSWSSGTSFPTTIVEAGMTTAGPASDWCFANGRDGSSPYPQQGYSWNGSSYSTFPKPPSSPSDGSGNGTNFGSNSSNLFSGLSEYPPGSNSDIMLYNGSSWSSTPTYPTKKSWTSTTTAGNTSAGGSGVIVGGSPYANTTVNYSYGLAIVALN